MNKDTVDIVNCSINEDVVLNDYASLINTNIGKMCMVGRFSKMAYSTLGDLSYIGDYSVVINSMIGKFTSISWGVTIGPEDHDYKRVTSHSFLYSVKSFKLAKEKHYSPFERPCTIGNDVWIGCNSTILRGVTIGDGAVVGANSLVNKDVAPYSIVGGSPAKVIKQRFSTDIIEKLLETAWWELPTEIISANAELFSFEPDLGVIESIRKLKNTM